MVSLSLWHEGRPVGRLSEEKTGKAVFSYDPAWLHAQDATEISYSMPLRAEPYSGACVRAFVSNLLPDADAARRRIAQELELPAADDFSLLAALGRDCIGALQFLPSDAVLPTDGEQVAQPISDQEIGRKLARLGTYPLGLVRNEDFRLSVSGAQSKTSLLLRNGGWFLPQGATPSTHILKVPLGILSQDGIDLFLSCENEWLCLLLCRLYGIAAAEAELRDFAGRKALVVARFDRRIGEDGRVRRLFAEDFCQALSVRPEQKYEKDAGPGMRECMALLQGSIMAQEDLETFFRAQALFWMMDAIDGHAKNFSILNLGGGRYRLAPLYDILSAAPLVASGQLQQQKLSLAMGVHGKNRHYRIEEIGVRQFVSSGRRGGLGEGRVRRILTELSSRTPDAVGEAERLSRHIPAQVREPIFAALRRKAERLNLELASSGSRSAVR